MWALIVNECRAVAWVVFDGKNKTAVLGGGQIALPLLRRPYGVHIYYIIYSQVKSNNMGIPARC